MYTRTPHISRAHVHAVSSLVVTVVAVAVVVVVAVAVAVVVVASAVLVDETVEEEVVGVVELIVSGLYSMSLASNGTRQI